MKKMVPLLLVMGLIASPNLVYGKMKENVEKEEKIIIFKNEKAFSAQVIKYGEDINKLKNAPILTGRFTKEEIERLKNNPNVLKIESNITFKIQTETQDWGMGNIQAPYAWDLGYTGKGVKVAVLDTGIDTEHEDLQVVGGSSFVWYTDSHDDDHGHGTHVAGIIAGKHNGKGIKGVAPNVELYGVKVLDDWGYGDIVDIVDAIDWAITNDMDIVNMSLGTPTYVSSLEMMVKKASENGVMIVAAAGNDGNEEGTGNSMNYPAKFQEVFAVGATDLNNKRAYFSSTGVEIDIAAPGYEINSTYPDNDYEVLSGTSMATPYVVGMMALYKEAYPSLTNQQLMEMAKSNAIDLGTVGFDPLYGNGLIQFPSKYNKVFKDVAPKFWAFDYIGEITDKGWMNGYASGNFKPNQSLTRAQAAVVMVKMLDLKPIEEIKQSFQDVPTTHWAYPEIEIAKQHGVFSGKYDQTFGPEESLTRAQAATIYVKGLKFPLENPSTNSFSDVKSDYWAYSSIETIKNKGIVDGYGNGEYKPNQVITRAQFAKNLYKIIPHLNQ